VAHLHGRIGEREWSGSLDAARIHMAWLS
jgi:hypothetical protein